MMTVCDQKGRLFEEVTSGSPKKFHNRSFFFKNVERNFRPAICGILPFFFSSLFLVGFWFESIQLENQIDLRLGPWDPGTLGPWILDPKDWGNNPSPTRRQKMAPEVRLASIVTKWTCLRFFFLMFRSAGTSVTLPLGTHFPQSRKTKRPCKKNNKSKVEFLRKEACVCKAPKDASCHAWSARFARWLCGGIFCLWTSIFFGRSAMSGSSLWVWLCACTRDVLGRWRVFFLFFLKVFSSRLFLFFLLLSSSFSFFLSAFALPLFGRCGLLACQDLGPRRYHKKKTRDNIETRKLPNCLWASHCKTDDFEAFFGARWSGPRKKLLLHHSIFVLHWRCLSNNSLYSAAVCCCLCSTTWANYCWAPRRQFMFISSWSRFVWCGETQHTGARIPGRWQRQVPHQLRQHARMLLKTRPRGGHLVGVLGLQKTHLIAKLRRQTVPVRRLWSLLMFCSMRKRLNKRNHYWNPKVPKKADMAAATLSLSEAAVNWTYPRVPSRYSGYPDCLWIPVNRKAISLACQQGGTNERTFPSTFLLAHGGTSSSGALPRVSNNWLAHHVRHDMVWDNFEFCFHPKMRALIGSVTSEQDVLGQQCLDQSSVQRHSRTLELPRNLILVLRGFLVSRAVSGRAFLEHRKTTQQASQLSFGCIVPSSLPRPLSLIATRSTIFRFECAFFVLGTAQLFQEQGRFSLMIFPCASRVSWVLRWWRFLRDNLLQKSASWTVRTSCTKMSTVLALWQPPVFTFEVRLSKIRHHAVDGLCSEPIQNTELITVVMFVEAVGNMIWKTSFPNCATFVVLRAQNTFMSRKATPAHVYRMPQGTKRETFRCKPVMLRWWLRCDALTDAFSQHSQFVACHERSTSKVFSALPLATFVTSCMPFASTCRSKLLWKALPPHKLIGGSSQIVFEKRYLEEATTGVEWSDQLVTSFI